MTTNSQLDHCTDLAAFLDELYPVENCEVVEYDAEGNVIKSFPMVAGEGAPQYTFDLPADTQLALL